MSSILTDLTAVVLSAARNAAFASFFITGFGVALLLALLGGFNFGKILKLASSKDQDDNGQAGVVMSGLFFGVALFLEFGLTATNLLEPSLPSITWWFTTWVLTSWTEAMVTFLMLAVVWKVLSPWIIEGLKKVVVEGADPGKKE